jgi:hypothetical protein
MQIPQSGEISVSVFESIKINDDIGIFSGNSNDITYQWLFIGSLIDSPKDENLIVNFSNARTAEVKNKYDSEYVQEFSFSTNELLGGNPTLSVYFAYPWNVDSVEVYHNDIIIGTAALENSPNAIITFIPQEYKGLFYFVGKIDEAQEIEAPQTNEAFEPPPKQNVIQDDYLTDPTPEGRPVPVEPEDAVINQERRLTAALSIRCDTILDNMEKFNMDKISVLPPDGIIMNTRTVVFYEGESVFNVLQREVRAAGIHMEFQWTPIYNSVYIQGINNIYEFDCGELSGWMYKVNGWFPNYGASRYVLEQGDIIELVYTCDLGRDVGGFYAVGE